MICALNRAGLGDKMQMNVMGGACGTYGEGRGVYGVLVGKNCQTDITWKDYYYMEG